VDNLGRRCVAPPAWPIFNFIGLRYDESMKCRFLSALFVIFGALASPALAWNSVGHEVVAMIAWDQLNDAQRAKLTEILKAHHRYEKDLLVGAKPTDAPDRLAFLQAAAWPDAVRSRSDPMSYTESHPQWHYIDYPYHTDGKTGPDPVEAWDGKSDPANLLQAMQKVMAEFKDPATKEDRRAIDLCWIEHLVGDVHQPLHAVSLYSDVYPNGDQGGNAIHVRTLTHPDIKLHTLWDDIEGEAGPDYHADPDEVRKLADRIEKEHPLSEFGEQLKVTDPKDWALESFRVAKSAVYMDRKIVGATAQQAKADPNSIPALPDNYEADGRKTADVQVAVAGYRLAEVLKGLVK
jgi:hypothetical protein